LVAEIPISVSNRERPRFFDHSLFVIRFKACSTIRIIRVLSTALDSIVGDSSTACLGIRSVVEKLTFSFRAIALEFNPHSQHVWKIS